MTGPRRKNGWSEAHTAIVRAEWPGDLALREIGVLCGGRSGEAVASKGQNMKLGPRKKKETTWTGRANLRFRKDWFEEMTLHQLSARYGRTVKAVVAHAASLHLGTRDGDSDEQKKRETEDITGAGVNRNITLVKSVESQERFKVKITDTERHV